jgi:hypothetical protein
MMTLRRGDLGKNVIYLQRRLIRHGLECITDGKFGKQTEGLVMGFQESWDLVVDGVVGSRTWGCLLQGSAKVRGVRDVGKKFWLLERENIEGSELGVRFCEISCLDLGMQESPWGSNRGPEISHLVQGTRITGMKRYHSGSEYKKHWGISGDKDAYPPWCAIAISGWLAELYEARSWSGIPFGNWFGGVTQTKKWGESLGVWREDLGSCRSGELFIMGRKGSGSDRTASRSAGHIGVILYDGGNWVLTMEGNASNGVRSRKRKKEDLWGVVNWEGTI